MNKFAVVTCIKDEGAYIFEHYLWYKHLGADRFYYIFNDCSDDTESRLLFLSTLDSSIKVLHNIVPDGAAPQLHGYRLFLKSFHQEIENWYLCVVDIDEFLLPKKHQYLYQLLDFYDNPDILSINWRIFGSSGKNAFQDAPVTQRFLHCSEEKFKFNKQIKSITRYTKNKIISVSAHIPVVRKGHIQSVRWVFASNNGIDIPVPESVRKYKNAIQEDSIIPQLNVAQINHYIIKSREEYNRRLTRGRGMKAATANARRHTASFFTMVDKNDIYDDSAAMRFCCLEYDFKHLSAEYHKYKSGNIGIIASAVNNYANNGVLMKNVFDEAKTASFKPNTHAKQTKKENREWNIQDIASLPHMQKEDIDLLEAHLKKTDVFLEYGAGGSTVFAAKLGVQNIHSVESDKSFLDAVQQKVALLYPSTNVNGHFVDIGKTKEWGQPVNKEKANHWPAYCVAPWQAMLENNQLPDLILIDGRFRVACFLASLLLAKEGTVILFDDYVGRRNYHIVEKYLQPNKTAGRMTEFIVKSNFSTSLVLLDLLAYCTIAK